MTIVSDICHTYICHLPLTPGLQHHGSLPRARLELLDPTRLLLQDWVDWSLLVYDIDPQEAVRGNAEGDSIKVAPTYS